jgi:hypothetical protein
MTLEKKKIKSIDIYWFVGFALVLFLGFLKGEYGKSFMRWIAPCP